MKKKWWYGLAGTLIAGAFAMIPLKANAAGVEIDENTFPDEVFRDIVSTNFDTSGDGFLSDEEIAAVRNICFLELTLEPDAIGSLEGIKIFNKAETIDIMGTYVTELDVSGCSELWSLTCCFGMLTSLDISSCTALQTLDCSYNALDSLDLSDNESLESLYCGNNSLSELDVSMCPMLDSLYCDNNDLDSLNISNNPMLENLYCGNCCLDELDVSDCPLLKSLSCSENSIRSLDVSNNPDMTYLICNNNGMGCLILGEDTYLARVYSEGTESHSESSDCYELFEYDDEQGYIFAMIIKDSETGMAHDIVIDPMVYPTTTSTGLTEGSHCSICGEVIVEQRIIAKKRSKSSHTHSWDNGEVTVEATCTEDGEKTFTCTDCGAVRTEVIPATGHTIVKDPAVEATEVSTGLTEGSHCSKCGEVIVEQQVIPKLNSKNGWAMEQGVWYFYKDGKKHTGWLKSGGKWYYLNASGIMQTGWKMISGDWYYFKASGAMAASEYWNGYWLGKDGKWSYKPRASWHKNSKGWWYSDDTGWYAKNGWLKINGEWYYFDNDGFMVTTELTLDGVVYTFHESGALIIN